MTGVQTCALPISQPTGTGFTPGAYAELNFTVAPTEAGFFASLYPFYGTAFAAFTNTPNQVRIISNNEFVISQGGGIVNFGAAPIPEPETYALMLAGLLAVGFIARRRTT